MQTKVGRRLVNLAHYAILIDYQGGTNPIYVGRAEPGSDPALAVWRIVKITWDVNNNPTAVQWAQGTLEFIFIWNNRTTYTYS